MRTRAEEAGPAARGSRVDLNQTSFLLSSAGVVAGRGGQVGDSGCGGGGRAAGAGGGEVAAGARPWTGTGTNGGADLSVALPGRCSRRAERAERYGEAASAGSPGLRLQDRAISGARTRRPATGRAVAGCAPDDGADAPGAAESVPATASAAGRDAETRAWRSGGRGLVPRRPSPAAPGGSSYGYPQGAGGRARLFGWAGGGAVAASFGCAGGVVVRLSAGGARWLGPVSGGPVFRGAAARSECRGHRRRATSKAAPPPRGGQAGARLRRLRPGPRGRPGRGWADGPPPPPGCGGRWVRADAVRVGARAPRGPRRPRGPRSRAPPGSAVPPPGGSATPRRVRPIRPGAPGAPQPPGVRAVPGPPQGAPGGPRCCPSRGDHAGRASGGRASVGGPGAPPPPPPPPRLPVRRAPGRPWYAARCDAASRPAGARQPAASRAGPGVRLSARRRSRPSGPATRPSFATARRTGPSSS